MFYDGHGCGDEGETSVSVVHTNEYNCHLQLVRFLTVTGKLVGKSFSCPIVMEIWIIAMKIAGDSENTLSC